MNSLAAAGRFSKNAQTPLAINYLDEKSLYQFYADGARLKNIWIPTKDYLHYRSVQFKLASNDDNEGLYYSLYWTLKFKSLAAAESSKIKEVIIKKTAENRLMFNKRWLDRNFKTAAELLERDAVKAEIDAMHLGV